MTIYAWARRRRFPRLPAPEARYFDVAPDARVLAHCHWQPAAARRRPCSRCTGSRDRARRTTCAASPTRRSPRGFNVVRLNQRNCGGTEALSAGLYHSGLTGDPLAVIRELADDRGPARFGVAGYSLGGNLALKLAGEYGDDPALAP